MALLPEIFLDVTDKVMLTAMGVFADWSQCNLNRISGTPQAMGASLPQQDVFRHSGFVQVILSGRRHNTAESHGWRKRLRLALLPFTIFMSTDLHKKCIRKKQLLID